MFFVTNLSGLFGPPASVAFAAHLGGFAAGLLLIRPWMEKRRADMAPWKGWESQASRRNPRMRRRD
jgi:membrane associated rhomboid family serine protease